MIVNFCVNLAQFLLQIPATGLEDDEVSFGSMTMDEKSENISLLARFPRQRGNFSGLFM